MLLTPEMAAELLAAPFSPPLSTPSTRIWRGFGVGEGVSSGFTVGEGVQMGGRGIGTGPEGQQIPSNDWTRSQAVAFGASTALFRSHQRPFDQYIQDLLFHSTPKKQRNLQQNHVWTCKRLLFEIDENWQNVLSEYFKVGCATTNVLIRVCQTITTEIADIAISDGTRTTHTLADFQQIANSPFCNCSSTEK